MTTPDGSDEVDKLNRRFAKKVDSLNWQSLSYQKKALQMHNAALARLIADKQAEELERFEPFFKGDHSKCPDPRTCIGYENARNDFDNEKAIRIAELKKGETTDD